MEALHCQLSTTQDSGLGFAFAFALEGAGKLYVDVDVDVWSLLIAYFTLSVDA